MEALADILFVYNELGMPFPLSSAVPGANLTYEDGTLVFPEDAEPSTAAMKAAERNYTPEESPAPSDNAGSSTTIINGGASGYTSNQFTQAGLAPINVVFDHSGITPAAIQEKYAPLDLILAFKSPEMSAQENDIHYTQANDIHYALDLAGFNGDAQHYVQVFQATMDTEFELGGYSTPEYDYPPFKFDDFKDSKSILYKKALLPDEQRIRHLDGIMKRINYSGTLAHNACLYAIRMHGPVALQKRMGPKELTEVAKSKSGAKPDKGTLTELADKSKHNHLKKAETAVRRLPVILEKFGSFPSKAVMLKMKEDIYFYCNDKAREIHEQNYYMTGAYEDF